MRVSASHIPAEITYVSYPPKKSAFSFSDVVYEENELKYEPVRITKVFDPEDAKGIKLAKEMAERACDITKVSKDGVKVETVPNEPITNLRLFNVDDMSSLYGDVKVLDSERRYFSIYADTLLETVLNIGVKPGGVLSESYIWCRFPIELRLIRVNSPIFDAVMEASNRQMLSTITKAKLEVGGIYRSRRGSSGIFLGHVDTIEYNPWDSKKVKTVKNLQLWFDIWEHSKEDPKDLFQKALQNPVLHSNFKLKTSHSMVKLIDKIPVESGVVELLRLKVQAYTAASYSNLNNTPLSDLPEVDLYWHVGKYAKWSLMRPKGQPEIPLPFPFDITYGPIKK